MVGVLQAISISPDNSMLAIGGMRGAVRLYRFVSIKEEQITSSNGTTKGSRRDSSGVKKEVKEEVIVLD